MGGEEESVLPFVMYKEYAEVLSIEVEEGDFSVGTNICSKVCVFSA